MSVLHHMLLSRVTNNIPDYFCLVALEDGTFTFNINENAQLTSIAYSLDGRNWTSSTTTLTTPTVAKGKSVYWKGVATKYSANSDSNTNNSYFSSTGNFYVKGDLMSLFYGDNFENQFEIPDIYAAASLFENCSKLLYANKLILKATTLKTGCYGRMFYNCTHLLAYPKLPATSLAQRCYAFMFGYCNAMVTAPELPATDLASYCYQGMFYYCSNLINPPELPATTLNTYCYMRMFEYCADLEVAPDLLAPNLQRYCYYYMFRHCTKLRFINAQFEDTTIPGGALNNWVNGVASEGIFLKNPISEFSTVGNSGIPTGWTVWTEVPDWLCFTALEKGTFTLTIPDTVTTTYLSYIEWSKDGKTWIHTDNTSEEVIINVQVAQGDKVYWKGSGVCMTKQNANDGYASNFSSNARFDVSGHIMSLLKGDDFESFPHLDRNITGIGIVNVTFALLFQNCTTLINAKDLVLPTFTSWYTYIYYKLFFGCTSLISTPTLPNLVTSGYCYASMFRNTAIEIAPELPATELSNSCYSSMFYGCGNLTTASALPATTLALNCYSFMYSICANLINVPDLPAAILEERCYDRMFQSSPKVNHIKCLATDISATYCVNAWLNGVSSTGTFIQAEGVEWPTGTSGIPTGWLIYDNGKDIPKGYTACDYISNPLSAEVDTLVPMQNNLYGAEFKYRFSQYEIDDAANNNRVRYMFRAIKSDKTDADNPKQTQIGFYIRNNTDKCGWVFNSGIYTYPDGRKSTNGTYLMMAEGITAAEPHIIKGHNDLVTGKYTTYFDGAKKVISTAPSKMNENPVDVPPTARLFHVGPNCGDLFYIKLISDDGETIIGNLVSCVRNNDSIAGFWDKINLRFVTSDDTTNKPLTAGYLT